MTKKMNQMKHSVMKNGRRSLAMLLGIVMLITAIGSGSVLSTLAETVTAGVLSTEALENADAAAQEFAEDAANLTDGEQYEDLNSVFGSDPISRKANEELAASGANVDLTGMGYGNTGYVKGSWDSWATPDDSKGHNMTSGYTVSLAANTTYEFVLVADNGDIFKKDTTISGSIANHDFPKDATANAKLKTTIAGDYTFSFGGFDGGSTSMKLSITFPAGTATTTWTAVGAYGEDGNSDAGFFGSAWAPTATANDLTKSGTTWTKTWSNVTLNSSTTVYYKVAKNHAWTTAYPTAANATKTIVAGTYNITITYDESDNSVSLTATSVAKSTLTVGTVDNATVTATYNGTTVNEDGYIDGIPQGAQVTINVTPIQGKKCTAVTGTYDTSSTVSASPDSTGKVWTLTMPGSDTTVSATIGDVTLKKIYFNNNYTLYGTVYAYVYDKDGSGNATNLYLGKKPGKVMIESENSEIWYIEVPENITYVQFISGEGYTTGEMSIPWTTYTYPKYTAPYGHNDAPNTTNGGTWGNYLYGSNNKRTNEYTVSDGSTMSDPNLFTGISATLYDYYTDGEITASAGTASDNGANGSPNGWIKGIANDEYCLTVNGWKWNPYTTLNSALSAYADNSVQPKYDVSKPLYFGNLNVSSMNSANTDYAINTTGNGNRNDILNYHGWDSKANNSIDLNSTNNAVTGLSGKTLGDDKTIHYYSSSDSTNENGAPMAMFNEDFLSGENNQNKALATILRTSSFPVRKTERYPNIYFDISSTTWWSGNNAKVWAHLWDDANNTNDVLITSWPNNIATIPATGYTHVKFVRCKNTASSDSLDWNNIWNQTGDLDIQDNGNVRWIASSDTNGTTSGSWTTQSTAPHHVYYEFDSTNGKDNAYIESIDKSNKTATINYYDASQDKKVHSVSNTNGFFPFNRNDYTPDQNKLDYAQDLGFGMKLEILFNLNNNGLNTDGTHQTFDFSGDDDLWVFIDGKLALDLGGAHGRTTGSIDFNTMTITANNSQSVADGITRNGSIRSIVDTSANNFNPNYVHTMTIYYMERGMFDSNLKFGFSFHAIPNMFWVDKKIRTKDKYNLGYDTLNSGFFTDNGKSGADSNMTTDNGKSMSKFEASFQNEVFTVEQKVNRNNGGFHLISDSLGYTIDNDSTTYYPSSGQYQIKHDLGNCFVGKFEKDDVFNLKEIIDSNNKYVYQPVFSVVDQANNDQTVTTTGNNSDGYEFTFTPTTAVTGGIDMLNLKARFDNYMVAHDLTLTKEITNAVDTTTNFTLKVTFDFDGNGTYLAYPLYCDVDGVRQNLNNDGEITVKAGQKVVIIDIPEKAKIKVQEVLTDTITNYRYGGITLTKGGLTVNPTLTDNSTKSIEFTMGDADMTATVSNSKPSYSYSIKYNYTPYVTSYSAQSYTVSGVFTEDEMTTYLQLDGSLNPEFQSDELKRTFVNIKAPYEDNFQQTLSFASSTISDTDTGKGWNSGTYTCEVTAQATTDNTINAYFNLPYAVDAGLVPQESGNSGRVAKITAATQGSKDINCFDWYVTSGKQNSRDSSTEAAPVYVKAPLILYTDVTNDSTVQYFQYWKVTTQGSYGKSSTDITRCYDYQFNLSLFMDCVIEPVYASSWAQTDNNPNPPSTYNNYGRFDPEVQIANDSTNNISIAFLENSRNQYNNSGNGGRTTSQNAADVIYTDFLLSFNNVYGTTQLNTTSGKKAGVVVEAVGYMNYEAGTTIFDYDKDYSNESSFTSNASTKATEITEWLTKGGTRPTGIAKSEFDVSALDNKNCIQYYYSLNNRAYSSAGGAQLVNTLQNRYKVFRAYAYIGEVGSTAGTLTNVKLSAPVYFTVYDAGSQGLDDNDTRPGA